MYALLKEAGITDIRLSQWLITNVTCILRFLNCVDVRNAADSLEIYAVFIIKVKVLSYFQQI
jgi:hypothetical protein